MKKSIYVPPELLLQMQKYNLNWSEIAQRAFRQAVQEEQKKENVKIAMAQVYGPYTGMIKAIKR